jgi:basic membrane protein A
MSHQRISQSKTHRKLILGVTLIFLFSFVLSPQAGFASSPKPTIMVGLIPDVAGVDDNGFNEMAAAGLARAATDFGILPAIYQPASTDEYAAKIGECVSAGSTLCITVGWLMGDATMAAAIANPGVNFAIVDMTWDTYPPNLRGISFASEQVGYLAGALAGLMSTSKVIGAIGGLPIPTVTAFMTPYQYGAQWADHSVQVLLEYSYDFGNPPLGEQMAQDQMARGADVIFAVAGPTGIGVNLETAQAGAWTIGVDVDAYYSTFGGGTVDGHEFLLTSALKRVDNAVYHTIEEVVGGTFTPGTMINNLENEGVGLAPYHDAAASIPQDVQDEVAAVSQSIINGETDVWEPFYKYSISLPVVMK